MDILLQTEMNTAFQILMDTVIQAGNGHTNADRNGHINAHRTISTHIN